MELTTYTVTRDDTYVLTIDVQERLAPAIAEAEACGRTIVRLLKGAAVFGLPGAATEQYPKGLGPTLPDIRAALADCGHPVFEKTVFTAYTPEIQAHLAASGCHAVIVVGMETHVCVYQTVRDLLEAGYRVFVPDDAVSSRKVASRERALTLFGQMGACVTRSETILFDLLHDAKAPEFKAISALIK